MECQLSRNVLVLNRLWQAVNVCSARRAFTLLCQGHAQVVDATAGSFMTMDFGEWRDFTADYGGEDVVSTISFKIRVPQIILLLVFDRLPKKDVKLTRNNVFERDHFTCQYCGQKKDRRDLNIDHVVPRHQGGGTSWENVVCSCIPCNSRKGNRTPAQANMHLRHPPKKPRWRPMLHIQSTRAAHDSWRHFLDVAYWNVELTD